MENEKLEEYKINDKNSNALFIGAKLARLILDNVTIINYEPEKEYLHWGCYIMYPWTGRIDNDKVIKELTNNEIVNYPFYDENKFPIHGLYQKAKRKIVKQSENSITFAPHEESYIPYFPYFEETFTIFENKLEIQTTFMNTSKTTQYFGYSYHPYIGMNNQKINNFQIKSNVNIKCLSTKQLIPELISNTSIKTEPCDLNIKLNDKFFDDLFLIEEPKDDPYFELLDEDTGKSVRVTSDNTKSIKLNYFQIYTPSSRTSIAVEPMSCPNNAFNIDFPNNLKAIKSEEKLEGKIIISLKK